MSILKRILVMACESLLFVLVVTVQLSAIYCEDYEFNEEDSFNRNVNNFDRNFGRARYSALVIGSIINTILLGVFYLCVKYCCPSCGRKVTPGFIFTLQNTLLPEVEPISTRQTFAENNIEL